MENLVLFLIISVSTIFDQASTFLSLFSDGGFLSAPGGGLTFAFALGAVLAGSITEGVLAGVRRWHGSIDDQFSNIDNLISVVNAHQATWGMPPAMLAQLTGNRDQLQTLISKCRSSAGSSADRTLRNSLLKSTVGFCLLEVRIWVYMQYTTGILTADDVHLLGFLLPGEAGGHHDRAEATDMVAEVKVKIVTEDIIRVVIDQSAGENAARVVSGWPNGVRQAVIVILAADGQTEVYRQLTTRLHNDIRMPDGSRGKQFIIKASFLRHINDEPRFGNQPTFSMPLATEDLAAALDHQHHADFEAQLQEVERHRQEVEELRSPKDV
jgi:hypothetical protein